MKPIKEKVAVIRESYVAVTNDYIKAIILNQLVYWTLKVYDFDEYINEETKRLKDNGINADGEVFLTHGWIYKSAKELSEETMLNLSPQTMLRHIEGLIKLGFLEKRTNPKIKWDKTFQYRVNLINLKKAIIDAGYNFDIKINSDEFNNHNSNDNASIFQNGTLICENGTAIPETNTEITTNTEYSELLKFWNEFARKYNLSCVTKLTDKRKTKLKARLKNKDFDLNKLLPLIAKSKFLLGENNRGWKIDFDWLIENDDHYTRILEGGYGINQNKKYSYQEVLQITGGQIKGRFKKGEDGFWYEDKVG